MGYKSVMNKEMGKYKIKDNIDLRSLEKYGYEDVVSVYRKYLEFGGVLFINKNTRKITRVHPYDCRTNPTEWDISDIQEAGFVEEIIERSL